MSPSTLPVAIITNLPGLLSSGSGGTQFASIPNPALIVDAFTFAWMTPGLLLSFLSVHLRGHLLPAHPGSQLTETVIPANTGTGLSPPHSSDHLEEDYVFLRF